MLSNMYNMFLVCVLHIGCARRRYCPSSGGSCPEVNCLGFSCPGVSSPWVSCPGVNETNAKGCMLGNEHFTPGYLILLDNSTTGLTGQNGSGQNGTDKMVWAKWYTDKMALDKM